MDGGRKLTAGVGLAGNINFQSPIPQSLVEKIGTSSQGLVSGKRYHLVHLLRAVTLQPLSGSLPPIDDYLARLCRRTNRFGMKLNTEEWLLNMPDSHKDLLWVFLKFQASIGPCAKVPGKG